jgi:hypothetical protein
LHILCVSAILREAFAFWRFEMSIIMILYYVISAFIAGMLIWNFVREKEDKEKMLLYLIVLLPFILRILRLR